MGGPKSPWVGTQNLGDGGCDGSPSPWGGGGSPPILDNPETVNKEGVHLERTILTIIKKCSTTVSFIFKKQ